MANSHMTGSHSSPPPMLLTWENTATIKMSQSKTLGRMLWIHTSYNGSRRICMAQGAPKAFLHEGKTPCMEEKPHHEWIRLMGSNPTSPHNPEFCSKQYFPVADRPLKSTPFCYFSAPGTSTPKGNHFHKTLQVAIITSYNGHDGKWEIPSCRFKSRGATGKGCCTFKISFGGRVRSQQLKNLLCLPEVPSSVPGA